MRLLETRQLGDVAWKYDYTSKLGADRWASEFCRRDPEMRDKARFYSSGDQISERPAPCPGLTLLKLRRPIPESRFQKEVCDLASPAFGSATYDSLCLFATRRIRCLGLSRRQAKR